MRRFFGLWFLCLSFLHAQFINIDDAFEYTKASSFMEYVADINGTLDIEHIDQAQWQPMLHSNLGGLNEYPSWTRCKIKNTSQTPKSFIIKNPRAGMDEIDLYVVRDHNITHQALGDQHSLKTRNLPHRYSVEFLELRADEEIMIISRLRNPIDSTEGEWEIFDRRHFVQFTMVESLWWGAFMGIYIALFFYAGPILIAANDKLLAFYFSLYILSSIGYQLSVNGILYSLGLEGNAVNITTLLFNVLFCTFTVLVMVRFITITHHQGLLARTLQGILILLGIEIIMAFLCFFEPHLIRTLAFMSIGVSLVSFCIWFLLLKDLLYSSKDRLFRFIFIGYSAIFMAYVYQTLISLGLFEMHAFSTYSLSLGSMFEMYFFALGISSYIRQMKKEKKKKEQMLDFQMRFASIGRVIGNISHQWKIPMVRAGALLTHIEALVHFKHPSALDEIEHVIPEIRSHFTFMQNTIDEFYSLYSKNIHKVEFKLLDVINDVWAMLSSKAMTADMKLCVKDLQDTKLFSFEYSLSHIFIILIDNAINAAKNRAIENPKIIIDIAHTDEMTTIIVEDNCGGIHQVPMESIFDIETFHTSKKHPSGGLGLSIVKLLVCEKLNGTINVQNTEHGTAFTIILHTEKLS